MNDTRSREEREWTRDHPHGRGEKAHDMEQRGQCAGGHQRIKSASAGLRGVRRGCDRHAAAAGARLGTGYGKQLGQDGKQIWKEKAALSGIRTPSSETACYPHYTNSGDQGEQNTTRRTECKCHSPKQRSASAVAAAGTIAAHDRTTERAWGKGSANDGAGERVRIIPQNSLQRAT